MEIHNIDHVKSREDFVEFVGALITDLFANKHEWENDRLDSYLEAISAWVQDMDGYYLNANKSLPENINWNVIAQIFLAAKYYE